MYNEYFPPYKAAVDAGAGSVMASFNEIDGVPATGNRWLLTDVLRDQWGFDGFVVTDWGAANNKVEGVRAGSNLEMPCPGADSALTLIEAVRSGVNRAHIIDGRLEHSIILELFSDEGIGTMFYQL